MSGNEVIVYEPKSLVVLERAVRRRLWSRLRALAASLPFAQELLAAYFCAVDPRTPIGVKFGVLGALAGFLMPQRLIPKMLRTLVVGGDIGLLLGALRSFAAHIRPEHRLRARLLLIRLRRERAA
ncbi:MAG TPA: DUF1232 domain-containing protein [Stellaceae bacterium]